MLLPVIISSCSKEENNFTLGGNLVGQESYVQLLDTFKVNLSTILLDSVPTSGYSTILCGRYKDNVFGQVSSESYFMLDKPIVISIYPDEIYDSTILVLTYNGYSFGDTTLAQTIDVHQLTSDFNTSSANYLYNTSKMSYTPNPVGSVHFIPTPHTNATLSIRIDDGIGKELYNLLESNAEEITNSSNFVNYFKGLVLTPGDSTSKAILGFSDDPTKIKLEVCTHRITETEQNITHDFSGIYSTYQFNHITTDFGNTDLASLSGQTKELPAGLTGNKSYVQGLTGLTTKIKFPYLNNLLLLKNAVLIKAELVIRPEKNSYDKISLPDSLVLYTTYRINTFGDPIVNNAGNTQVANFMLDKIYNENTSYTFDITYYLQNELSDNYYDTQNGLLVFFPNDAYYKTLNRLVVDAGDLKPQLKLYMMFY